MKKELANTISNSFDFKIISDYSGRGMFGDTTYAVVVPDIKTLLNLIIENADTFVDDDGYPLFDTVNLQVDTLGLDVVVY